MVLSILIFWGSQQKILQFFTELICPAYYSSTYCGIKPIWLEKIQVSLLNQANDHIGLVELDDLVDQSERNNNDMMMLQIVENAQESTWVDLLGLKQVI